MKKIVDFFVLDLFDKLNFFSLKENYQHDRQRCVESAFYAIKIGHPFFGVFYKSQKALYFAEQLPRLDSLLLALASESGYYIDLSKPFLNCFQEGEIVKAKKGEVKNSYFPLHGFISTIGFLDAARKIEEHFPTQSEYYIERAEKWLNRLRNAHVTGNIYSDMSIFDFKDEISPIYPCHHFTPEALLP